MRLSLRAKLHRLVRRLALALAGAYFSAISCGALAQGPASGFDAPGAADLTPELIRTIDLQKALIWTGHYDAMVDGDFGKRTRSAIASWQQDNGLQATGELTPQHTITLIRAGARIRDTWQWKTYRNGRVGYSIGYAARVFRPAKSLANGGIEFTSSYPGVSLQVLVGSREVSDTFSELYDRMSASNGSFQVHYKVRTDNWFVVAGNTEILTLYQRAERRASGVVGFMLGVPREDPDRLGVLINATANSFSVDHDVRPDVSAPERAPPPRTPPPAAAAQPLPTLPSASIDRTGRTGSIQLRLASQAPELRAQDVFERVSGAVHLVVALSSKRDTNDPSMIQGSAVAISSRELLTNCHVVQGAQIVMLVRQGTTMQADVVSADVEADRCVLRAEQSLPAFVKVRPYADTKQGETVYSIGAPQSYELTIAKGLLSGKRMLDGQRYIQTDAPISPGSSGGGLFDAAGNLLGITTFSRKNSQNLNFAIAGEEYSR